MFEASLAHWTLSQSRLQWTIHEIVNGGKATSPQLVGKSVWGVWARVVSRNLSTVKPIVTKILF